MASYKDKLNITNVQGQSFCFFVMYIKRTIQKIKAHEFFILTYQKNIMKQGRLRKWPPRAPPNGRDCNISERGCQAKSEKKFHKIPGTWHENIFTILLAYFSRWWADPRRSICRKNALGFDLAHFILCLTWRFFAKTPVKTLFFEGSKIARCPYPTGKTRCEI